MKNFSLCFVAVWLFVAAQSIVFSANYYWVGGSGNWSDLNHWVTTSGGSTYHLQVPQPTDDVFFDANSFTAPGQTVTINVGNAVCRNMDWTGAQFMPQFAGTGVDFRIFGSLTLINAMNFSFSGTVSFEATSAGHTITSNGIQFNNYVYFNGIGGSWTLQDEFRTSGWIYHTNGSLISNNQNITCSSYYSNTTNVRSLQLGSSVVTVTSSTWSWWMDSDNMTFNAGTSHIIFTSATSPGMRYADNCQFYDVSFTNPLSTADMISMTNAQFHALSFAGSANINGSHSVGTLTFSAGKTYVLQSSQTLTITTDFIANGTCQNPIFMYAATSGTFASINKSSGTVILDRIIMKDIHAGGGASFTANNSTDLGNNTGWTINPAGSTNLYWVGGTGNWDDTNHWSFTSGGPGGACVPTPYDDVFFDANSFSAPGQVVTINANHAFCRNMTWTGAAFNPTLAGTSTNNLHIHGSLVFINAMNLTFNGYTYFESKVTGKTITSAGQQFKNYVYFDGIGGGWSFVDAFNTTSWIQLINGSLNTNSQQVDCGAVYSNNSNVRGLTLGSSTININSSTWSWWVQDNNLTFDSGTSLIRFTSNTSPGMRYSDNMVFYDVEWTNPAATADIISMTNSSYHSMTFAGNANINGSHTYGTLNFAAAKQYVIAAGTTQNIITALNAAGSCTGYIFMYTTAPGSFATFNKSSGAVTVDFVILKDIHAAGGATFTANNSVDLGNNTGWTINPYPSQDLYWVGGTGNWDDSNHWAFTSGGAPGACVPTPNDNVFFDANSFTGAGQTVTINIGNATCKNMSWNGALFTPAFTGPSANKLLIYGSLELTNAMNYNFLGNVYFEATAPGQTILSAGQQFKNYVYFNGVGGGWTLLDALNTTGWIYHVYGSLATNSQDVTCAAYYSNNSNIRSLNLGASQVTVTGSTWSWWMDSDNLTFDAGTSYIRFTSNTSPGMRYADNVTFYRVSYTNSSSTADMISMTGAHFHSLTFKGNANINGSHSYDTLTFSPGMTYRLQSNQTQTIVHELNIRGNGCFPITLRSITPGVQSIITKTSGIVSGEFIEMSDQNATGGATFYAGDFSSDVTNNTGWIFTSSPNYVFGLGNDTIICPGDTIILHTNNFNGGISWDWYDGSTEPVDTITAPGTYWVTVTYGNNCFISDTIFIDNCFPPISLDMDYADETCDGYADGWATVTPSNGTPPYSFLWSTGSANDTIYNLTAGTYYVTVTDSLSMTAVDSVVITYQNPLPVVSVLPSSAVICEGDSVQFAASGADTYVWTPSASLNDSTAFNPVAFPALTTTYTVVGSTFGCTGSSDITVTVYAAPTVNLGPDTTICSGDNLTLDAGAGFTGYSWLPSGSTQQINVTTGGTYSVTVTDGNTCQGSDAITVSVVTQADATITSGTEYCSNDAAVTLTATDPGGTWWGSGITNPSAGTFNPGTAGAGVHTVYYGIAGSCGDTASTNITVYAAPTVNLGPDTTICSGDNLTLDAGAGFTGYSWLPSGSTQTINVTTGGTYSVTVTDGNTCQGSDAITVSVVTQADATITSGTEYCSNDAAVTLTATDPGGTWWGPGITNPSAGTFNPGTAGAGVHTVYYGIAGSCGDTASTNITVYAAPTVNLGPDTTICSGDNLTLDAGAGFTGYSWLPSGSTQQINVTTGGTYSVTVTDGNTCQGSDAITVSVVTQADATITSGTEYCSNITPVTLSATDPGGTWWGPGITNPSAGTFNPGTAGAGVHTVYYGIAGSCGDTASTNITVNAAPVVDLGADTTICSGETLALDAGPGSTWQWSPSGSTQTINVTTGGTYSVTVTDGNTCQGSDAITVSVVTQADATITSGTEYCSNITPVTLSATDPGGTWTGTGITNGSTGMFSPGQAGPGTHTIYYSITGICGDMDSVDITVWPSPSALVYSYDETCIGADDGWAYAVVTGGTLPYSMEWSNSATTDTVTGLTPDSYVFTVTDANGCSSLSMFTVLPGADECLPPHVYIPNVFSPNGDGQNDVLYVRGEGIEYLEFIIYDRWGQKVFETSDKEKGWDGTFRNEKCNPAVFTYVLTVQFANETEEQKFSGTITLVK